MYPCLVHLADGCGTLVDGRCIGGIIILSLAPGTAFSHITIDALLCGLRTTVQGQEWSEFILVNAIKNITDNSCFLAT